MSLRTWLRQPVSTLWLHLLIWPSALLLLLFVVALAFEYFPDAWTRLTTRLTTPEDLGARLRRECKTVAREVLPGTPADSFEREEYIRACIDSRAKLFR
jgi:hypothetical protein